jgi:hypothetical protein
MFVDSLAEAANLCVGQRQLIYADRDVWAFHGAGFSGGFLKKGCLDARDGCRENWIGSLQLTEAIDGVAHNAVMSFVSFGNFFDGSLSVGAAERHGSEACVGNAFDAAAAIEFLGRDVEGLHNHGLDVNDLRRDQWHGKASFLGKIDFKSPTIFGRLGGELG